VNEQVKGSGKKIYQEPSLRVYGDIRVLTQSVSMHAHVADAKVPKRTA
jgi:hypothetical protein